MKTRSSKALPGAAATLAVALVGLALAAGPASASTRGEWTTVSSHGRTYLVRPHGRFGVFPTKQAHQRRQRAHGKASANNLRYGGGVDGIGVTTGSPKIYVVYYGSQWGTETTGSDGYLHYSGDPKGLAPYQQAFFTGVGTGSELWSGVMTQYCEGVASGSQTCPGTAPHVGYPTGGALAGVWEDATAAAPANATQAQIAAEAVRAAALFGNTTAASNRNVEYAVTFPTGTHPDGFNTLFGNFCAWHDFTSSSYGDIAYTNMPYVPDAGASCGAGFVNGGNQLDGVSIVNGHEYAETITDQNPAGGWTDTSGEENADKCAWISSGQGASQDITLTTGTFAVQSTWANDFNGGSGGCEITHAVVGGGGSPDFFVSASPPNVSVTQGSTGTSTISTTTSGGFNSAVSLSASGVPSGTTASFNPTSIPAPGGGSSTMSLTVGSATATGTYAVTVTGTGGGATHTTSVSLTVTSNGGGSQLLKNPGFETGTAAPWKATIGVIDNTAAEPARSGAWKAWLDGYGATHTDHLFQQVAIPGGAASATLTFWLHIDTSETTAHIWDTLDVQIRNSSNAVLATLATYSNMNAASGYLQRSFNLNAYRGQTIRVYLLGREDGSLQTSFVADDFALNTT
jgi:serine protease